MIERWSAGVADDNMAETILVDLAPLIHRHPWWRARASLTLALLRRLRVAPPARVIDVGCGWGTTLEALERRGFSAVGGDISRRTLDALDRPGRGLVELDLNRELPTGIESFDAVLALDVIEHLDDDRSAVERLGELARPGGVVIVSVPALPDLWTEFDAIQGHRRRYLPSRLLEAFEGTGLEVERLFWWGRLDGPDPPGLEENAQGQARRIRRRGLWSLPRPPPLAGAAGVSRGVRDRAAAGDRRQVEGGDVAVRGGSPSRPCRPLTRGVAPPTFEGLIPADRGRPGLEERTPMADARSLADLETGRDNNFDAIRLTLALLVIFSHSYPLLLGDGNRSEPLFRATDGQRTFGEVAVDGFFLISGFLTAASWRRSRGVVDFLKRRALRVYPGYMVAVVFSSLIVGPLIAADASDYWRRFSIRPFLMGLLNLTGAFSPDGAVNGSLWSIRYEFHCYLALAALGMVGALRLRPLILGYTLGCSALEAAIQLGGLKMPGSGLGWLWGYPQVWPRLAACYLGGVSFRLYADRVVHSGRLAMASVAGLIAAATIPTWRAFTVVEPYFLGYLVFYLGFLPGGRLRHIARRGDLSYGLYLYGFPIQLLMIEWFGPRLSPVGLGLLSMAATSIPAALSWHLVERPFLALKRSPRAVVS